MDIFDAARRFIQSFRSVSETFEVECIASLETCGDYSDAYHYGLYGVPILLFEDDAVFEQILSALEQGTQDGLLSGFETYITKQEAMYADALELYTALPSSAQSKAAPVHETLFPFHLGITGNEAHITKLTNKMLASRRVIVEGDSGPWPLVRIKALIDAYHWAHSSTHINQARGAGTVPAIFLTEDCIALYVIVLRAKIGLWLVQHEA